MIEDLVFEGDTRKLYKYRHISGKYVFRKVSENLLKKCSTIFILTGFYIPSAKTFETDGPPGAFALFNALKKLKKNVYIVVDETAQHFWEHQLNDTELILFPVSDINDSEEYARYLLKTYHPDTVIAIERPGKDQQGIYRTTGWDDITSYIAKMDILMTADGLYTIGIGDGGNEMGFGVLKDLLPENVPVTITSADDVLIGGTSNWAAYGLIAALEIISGQGGLLPSSQEVIHMMKSLMAQGAVDGITHKKELSVDGFPLETTIRILEKLKTCSKLIRSASSLIHQYKKMQKERYGVPAMEIDVRYEASSGKIIAEGVLLLSRQSKDLRSLFEEYNISVEPRWTIRSESNFSDIKNWVKPVSYPLDLMDRPEGRLTTQTVRTDEYVRELWRAGPWVLIQTPDMAMGWCRRDQITTETITVERASASWKRWIRPSSRKFSDVDVPIDALNQAAAALTGIPYLLGGRSPKGLDCSALTQKLFQTFGIMLPRHSRDQKHSGIRVSLTEMRPGDLIFAVGRKKRFRHVAVLLSENQVIHACRRKRKSLIEPIETFRESYQITGARRVVRIVGRML